VIGLGDFFYDSVVNRFNKTYDGTGSSFRTFLISACTAILNDNSVPLMVICLAHLAWVGQDSGSLIFKKRDSNNIRGLFFEREGIRTIFCLNGTWETWVFSRTKDTN